MRKNSKEEFHSAPPEQEKKLTHSDHWERFFAKHGRRLLYSILCIVILIAVFTKMIGVNRVNNERDYIHAEHYFFSFVKTDGKTSDPYSNPSLTKLKEIMTRHPELHAKYDASIVHTLLKHPLKPDIRQHIADVLERTQSYIQQSPLEPYRDFTEASLLINERQYKKGLESAINLQKQIDENHVLFIFNLLRVATLYQQLGDVQQERKTWKTLQEKISQNIDNPLLIFSYLREGNVSLADYVKVHSNY